MLAAQIVVLLISLLYIWTYILTGVHSEKHRLLPLLLGLLVLFNFYEIVETITEQHSTINLLEALLFVQVAYLLICYMLDFLEIKLHLAVHVWLFLVMAYVDMTIFFNDLDSTIVIASMGMYCAGCALFFVIAFIQIILTNRYNKRELRTRVHFAISMLIPTSAITFDVLSGLKNDILMMIICELGIAFAWNMILTGSIIDTSYLLRTRVFEKAEIPTILCDPELFLVTANETAKATFPEELNTEKRRLLDLKPRKSMWEYKDKYTGLVEEMHGRYYRWQITDVYVKKTLRGYIVQLIDITEQKEAERQTALKGMFLASASHELRSPLHAIIGISDLLMKQQGISTKNKTMARHIRNSGTALLKTVNSILDFSKMEAGQFQLAEEKYEFLPILRSLTRDANLNLMQKPVLFDTEVLTDFPKYLMGDEAHIHDMIQNLISNAIKFTDEGVIRCEIRMEQEEGRYCLQCEVTDSGCGMTPEVLDTIFDDYVSFAGGAKEGTGLGLSNVNRYAKMMGGFAYAKSDGVNGSTVGFRIYQNQIPKEEVEILPAFKFNPLELLDSKEQNEMVVVPSFICPTAKALLADDMDVNRQIFREAVAPWQFQLVEVSDGDEAVEAVRKEHFDLIILDLRMPRMNGDVALGLIRELADTPVVLMSANLFKETKQEYMDMGFTGALSKPLDMNEIKETVETLMPEDKLIAYRNLETSVDREASIKSQEARVRTLRTFRKELQEVADHIEEIFTDDLSLFQTRVHGIKGVAKQLGFMFIGERSEIMEMAAKTENLAYIRAHMGGYIEEIREEILEVEQACDYEQKRLDRMLEDEKENALDASGGAVEMDKAEKRELFQSLHIAYEAFDLSSIEEYLEKLKGIVLSDREKEVLNQATEAADDFDYEVGAELLKKLIESS